MRHAILAGVVALLLAAPASPSLADAAPEPGDTPVVAIEGERLSVDAGPILYVSAEGGVADNTASEALGVAYGKVMAFMGATGITQVAAPMAITRSFDQKTLHWAFDAAIPVDKLPDAAALAGSEVKAGQSPAGNAVRFVHTGPYSTMKATYDRITAWFDANGVVAKSESWEHYVTDPGSTPEADLVTHIYFLVE